MSFFGTSQIVAVTDIEGNFHILKIIPSQWRMVQVCAMNTKQSIWKENFIFHEPEEYEKDICICRFDVQITWTVCEGVWGEFYSELSVVAYRRTGNYNFQTTVDETWFFLMKDLPQCKYDIIALGIKGVSWTLGVTLIKGTAVNLYLKTRPFGKLRVNYFFIQGLVQIYTYLHRIFPLFVIVSLLNN